MTPVFKFGVKLGPPAAKNARIAYATSASGNVMTDGLAPIWSVPLVAALVGVAFDCRPMVARELVKVIMV